MELLVSFLRWPFAVYVVWAVPVLYLLLGLVLRVRSTARRSAGAPAPASASAGIPRIPAGVHPLMVEAMMSNDVLGDHNKGVGTLEWLAACAMHTAATENSVTLETRAPAGMDDEALFEMVDVRRVAPVRDAVDAAVLGCYLPTGEEMSEMMAHLQEYEQRATTDAARRFLDKMRESVTVQRQDEATLGSVLKRLRADYSSMSGAFATMRGRLRALACQAGYMEDADPYHGERWRQWGGSLVLLWTAAGMLTAGGSGLPQGAIIVGFIAAFALTLATAQFVIPWTTPLNAAGEELADEGKRICDTSVDELLQLGDRELMDVACFLTAHQPGGALTMALARAMDARGAAEPWQRAFVAWCAPIPGRSGDRKRGGVSVLACAADTFQTIEIDERDDGVDV